MRQQLDLPPEYKKAGMLAIHDDKFECEECGKPTRILWRMYPGGPIRKFCSTKCAGPAVIHPEKK